MYLYGGNRVVASGVSRVYVHHLCAHTCRRARVAERPHFAVDALTFSSVTWSGETGRAGALTRSAWRLLCIGGSLPATKTLPQQHAEVWGTTGVAAACGGALCLPIELCRRGGGQLGSLPMHGLPSVRKRRGRRAAMGGGDGRRGARPDRPLACPLTSP